MKAIISANSLKTFQIVLNCLSKIGEDITIEARRDSLKLSTLNLTRTCFGTFTFSTAFFESYGWNTEARSIQVDQQGEFLRCKLAAKAVLAACTLRGKSADRIERCCIFMDSVEGIGEESRLSIEMVYKQGGAKTHKLRYQTCENEPQVRYDKSQCSNHWTLASSTLMGSLEHFSSKVEEIIMECKKDSISFRSVKDDNDGREFSAIEIESYTLKENVELTFSMKEFKVTDAIPLVLATSFPDVLSVEFAIATIVDADAAEEMAAGQAQTAASNNNDDDDGFGAEWELSQADNAFLESEAAWGNLMDVDPPPAATTSSHAVGASAVNLTANTQYKSQVTNEQGENEEEDTIIEERRRSRKRVKAIFSGDD
ncbi:hypothetical protein DFQ27_004815 [Actinomortierella ambigua]|uniref:DNA repair protein rad9 n=1 Tax=Actinomortierella ambigua TaxID=1343610 RepID=A0A9P6Q0V8_9FUNG|nr:hypothetical protein DFQ27_004815 [Actinomortierella ambigua]